ncbi:Tip49/RuvB-like helicase [Hamiltosporidium magnivora]|uniref:RuvB-like helicase n=1 Tax=Hamiltosporidium magnivora TaxID=148818 RepID=A0A4Q9LDL0_9MICR|nr:Tip49/RuvB-like helicase [Hamiltosporidium magnivora]
MEIKELASLERIGSHSHITGLGVENDEIKAIGDGLVGQVKARKALNLIKKLVLMNKNSGRIILMTGKPGTGKTAIATGLSKSLGNVPITTISGSEVYSLEMSKSECLTQSIRKCMAVRIKEKITVIEGEVVEINIEDESRNFGKIILKTTEMESSYDLGEKMIEQLNKENILAGDVIQINKETGKVFKIGKSSFKKGDFDALGPDVKYFSCPDGELIKIKDDEKTVTLHEIDVINSRTQGYLALFSGESGEIRNEIREEVNKKVEEWVNEGKAEFITGILFIDEVHILDNEAFSFLNKISEDEFCPILILASNKEILKIDTQDGVEEQDIPKDFIDRALIVKTDEYTGKEIESIVKLRMEEENIAIDEESLKYLVDIATNTSLRYSLNLLTFSNARASKRNRSIILEDIKRVSDIFLDENRAISCLNK